MKIVTYQLRYTSDEWSKIKSAAALKEKSIKEFIDDAIKKEIAKEK